MDSAGDDELAGELYALTRQLRGQLLRHAALGAWAAPGNATARPVIDDRGLPPGGSAAEGRRGLIDDRGLPPGGSAAEGRRGLIDDEMPAPVVDAPARSARTLTQIRDELGECTRCKLHTTRRKIVFGVGSADTPLMFVGEAPGEQEDKRGEPFVGPAGELLDKMIEAMGWTRGAVYIANTTKCRPPGNRNPQPDELEQCMPFLHAQIAAIAPRIIVALGRPASNQLLEIDAPISSLRGKFHDYPRGDSRGTGPKIMPTFHPAYLLRDPDKKRLAWADLKLVMAELSRLGIAPPTP
jgi:uracil-DNA glycosylase family 4